MRMHQLSMLRRLCRPQQVKLSCGHWPSSLCLPRVATQAQAAAKPGDKQPEHVEKSSAYKGVSWDGRTERWKAVMWDKKTKGLMFLGRFDSEEEAARAYDAAVVQHIVPLGGVTPVNFHTDVPREVQTRTKQYHTSQVRKSSAYKGVSWFAFQKCWQAKVRLDGCLKTVGVFTSELEAARAVDVHLIKQLGKNQAVQRGLNFPVEEYDMDALLADETEADQIGRTEAKLTLPQSPYRGVSWAKHCWRADAYVLSHKYYLGQFESDYDAAVARDLKLLEVKGKEVRLTELNLPHRYQEYLQLLANQHPPQNDTA